MKTFRPQRLNQALKTILALFVMTGISSVYAQSNSGPTASASKPARTAQSVGAAPKEETLELTPEENAKYNEALELFNKQDLQGALGTLRELTNGNPAARPPRVIAAFWYSQLKNTRAARIMLEMAVEEDSNDPEAYFALAEISLREGELTAAELLTNKGSETLSKYNANPTRKKSLQNKELALKIAYSTSRKRWKDVYNLLLVKIKADGETADLDRACANALFQLKQDSDARDMLLRADKLAKGEGLPADAAMSQLYAARGDLASAKKSLDSALKANPKSTPVLLLSITNALAENNLDSAWQLVQQLYQEDKSVDVLKTYGKVALFRSDYKHAEAAFQEAVRQSPLDVEASNGLALALCEQNNEEKGKRAVQYAAGNIQKQQNNRDFLATLGWVLYRTGQTEEAIKVLQQSTADGQINAASAYYFAVVVADKGQTEEAKKFLTAALGTKLPFAKRAEAAALLQKIEQSTQK